MNTEKKDFKSWIKRRVSSSIFPLVVLLILMVIIFTVWAKLVNTEFFQFSTLRNILQSLVVTSFLTIGAGCLLMAGHIDLSQSAIGALGGMVMAMAIFKLALPWWVAILLCLVVCAIFGAINAFMVTKLRFPSFIATLAMASMAKGIMYLFSSLGGSNGLAQNINFTDSVINFLGNAKIGVGTIQINVSVFIMIAFFIVFGILMSKTRFGSKVILLGGNPVAANLAGINSDAIMFILFILSGVMGGVSGVFTTARMQQGMLTALTSNQFTGITAAILGGISFGGGSGNMAGAFVGLLILNTFEIGMRVVGVNPDWIKVFSGILLLVALTFDFISRRRKSRVTL